MNEWLTFEYTSFDNQLKFTSMCKDMLPLQTISHREWVFEHTYWKMLCYHIICDIICLPGPPLNSMQSATNVIWEMCLWSASNMAKCS